MNPLSALGSLPLNSLQSLPQQLGRGGAIPQAELARLTSMVGGGDTAAVRPGAGPVDFQKLSSFLPAGASPTTAPLTRPETSLPVTAPRGTDAFGNLLEQMVTDVNAKGATASDSVNGLLGGKDVSLHQTMIAMEEASVSFQLMVEVRNKLLESYQELMRMQV